ncbi:hypothetical protein PMAYCL1PPCAC_08155, partial [Pristionchus mayeri]
LSTHEQFPNVVEVTCSPQKISLLKNEGLAREETGDASKMLGGYVMARLSVGLCQSLPVDTTPLLHFLF